MARRADHYAYEQALNDLLAIYRSAQREISAQVIAAVKSGDLTIAGQRRAQLARLLALLDQIGAQTDPMASRLVAQAHSDGAALAATQIAGAAVTAPEIPGSFAGIQREAISTLQDAILGRLSDSRRTVGRQAQDIYRKAGLQAATRAHLGVDGSTRTAKRQLMLSLMKDKQVARLMADSNGAVGFVDKAGKRWGLDTYAEMVVRTTTREAAVQGSIDRMVSHGVNLARVSVHSDSCDICKPYEGRLVSLDGQVTTYQGESAMDASTIPPYHPNCAHSLSPVVAAVDATRARLEAARA